MVMTGDTMVEVEEEVVAMIARGGPEVRAYEVYGTCSRELTSS